MKVTHSRWLKRCVGRAGQKVGAVRGGSGPWQACWAWRESSEKGKDASSFLTLIFSPLPCAKMCLQFNIFSNLNAIVFAALFNRTFNVAFGLVLVRMRHFGSVLVVRIWVAVHSVWLNPISGKAEVRPLLWPWDKKSRWGDFWNFEICKIRKLDTKRRWEVCTEKRWGWGSHVTWSWEHRL